MCPRMGCELLWSWCEEKRQLCEDEPMETAKDDKPDENKLTVPLNDPTLLCRMTNGPQLISSSLNLSQ
jgi:hypothetical protein